MPNFTELLEIAARALIDVAFLWISTLSPRPWANPVWIEWALAGGLVAAITALVCATCAARRNRQKLNNAHAFLVGLKPSIRGERRQEILAAINDQLGKLNK